MQQSIIPYIVNFIGIFGSPQDYLDLRAPPDMYKAAAVLGAKKASLSVQKIFILSILSGIHIGFGEFLVLSFMHTPRRQVTVRSYM